MYSFDFFINAVRYALDKSNYNLFLKVKQYKVLESLVLGRDTFAVLPTGYRKSVVFHLLPFIFDFFNAKGGDIRETSIVLVLTPLNALIEDQMACLRRNGIEADVLNTNNVKHINPDNQDDGMDDEAGNNELESPCKIILEGNAKLVFAHPEAVISSRKGRKVLLSDVFQQRVVACVIDEGHLIDEWGFEFRPDFGKLSQLGSIFPSAPFLVLTATAPLHIRETIVKSLLLYKPVFVVANLDRPNIYIRKEKRIWSNGSNSYNALLLPIAKDLKNSLREYPLTLIYLPLKWCGYAFKLFMDEIGEKSYFPQSEKNPENCLFAQFHAPQTERMKHEIMKQLTGKNEDRVVRVVFATIAIEIGVNIHDIRHSKEFPDTSCNDDEDVPELIPVRNVSDGQRQRIRDQLIAYRSQLGTKRFGGIDISTGVTVELIDSIVLRCHTIKSAEDLFAGFEVWDIKYAHAIFKIIGDVCAS
ncbi:ATP-dependent DNA helicase Q1 [Paramuricea clavata]|uniref:ATP-dependent DNA helicase Q1 n=1 Tax=Paramuricea clavata TaxID=317549 RepID=A0A7D9HUZ6_PARCT|nr:ATP-dependent DNA helicase Q1 [Paramuricea clavata]